jgi:hypothetical protein
MREDGSYEQRQASEGAPSCQQLQIERAAKHHKQATRLKRRRPRSAAKRNTG